MEVALSKINDIYREFGLFWNSPECDRTRDYLQQLSAIEGSELMHPLGSFVILYTPIALRPPLMLIGNNPSWFHKSDPDMALANLRQVAARIPEVNSYRAHDHTFGNALIRVFDERLNRPDLLDLCVGLNRFWVQTGSKGVGSLFANERRQEGKKIVERCELGTREIIQLVEPKAVALMGKDAQNAVPTDFQSRCSGIVFHNCRHPSRGGESTMADDLNNLIAAASI